MLFNTFTFFILLFLTFAVYSVCRHRLQNYLLLLVSYVFYCSWDYRFAGLILLSTLIDFLAGKYIAGSESHNRRKSILAISVVSNLGILGFFKYFNFFSATFTDLMMGLGFEASPVLVKIILPVGISFYTFQSMSYTVDVFRRQIKPVQSFLDYALYVSFFPQLVAGPIERASHLMPQILNPRSVSRDKIYEGAFLVFYGLFLKSFVGDNLARVVDPVFAAKAPDGLSVILASYGFTFQIFTDFAGYSYMARGIALFLGFDLMYNFNVPYISKDPQEFWSRWHISLSSWLRDYLYIPLGGNRKGKLFTYKNLLLTMLLGGLWHGANLTFIFWGLYHGILLILYRIFQERFPRKEWKVGRFGWLSQGLKVLIFFHFVILGWVLFRAESLAHLILLGDSVLSNLFFDAAIHLLFLKKLAFFILPLLLLQVPQVLKKDQLAVMKLPVLLRSFVYIIMFYLILIWGVSDAQDFIYFQF